MSETKPSTMEAVNRRLDEVLVEFFECVGELYKEQADLENIMKNGFLMMSRARYNMGAKSVGVTQYDETNMKASKVVLVTDNDDDDNCVNKMFELVNANCCLDESLKDPVSKGLRQRKSGGKDKVETVGSENVEQSTHNSNNTKKNNDPIKWFGVLVPQSLRQSQAYFKQATDNVIKVSNLKSKVMHLKEQYKSLQKEKQLIHVITTQ
ncbi:coiled-coil domain-containing protein 115-like [Mytilus californianus]|uniref:coiled-coil domain-containing protein 115-like n=1 Tax=Mytilus californianus TaxID=6549 RepID=UPI0022452475|nr:coiled-coil domain-containing protein 115-like [Mytilus californianus]XP_052082344.1 coiled-coil domain-containing protein 115-like [Mytilus californianus]